MVEALRSALAQTLLPNAVWVVDDAACERTRGAVEEIARSSAVPVAYRAHREGRGPSTSRNLGARAADAEWIAFLDDDDRWLPGYLEAATSHTEADLVLVGRWDFDGAGVRTPGKVPEASYDERKWLRRNLGGTGSSTVIRRALFHAIGGYDPLLRSGQDRDLILRAMRAGARYAAVQERLMEHRDDGPRITIDGPTIVPARLRFLRKHASAMSVGDIAYTLRKIVREAARARWRRSERSG